MNENPDVVECPACHRLNRVPPDRPGAPFCHACSAALPWLVPAGEYDFIDIAEGATLPVLLDLWAPWCGPCRAVAPALRRIAEHQAGRLKIVKVNVDHSPELAARLDVRGIPTLILMQAGREVDRLVGAMPEHHLEAWIRERIDRLAA